MSLLFLVTNNSMVDPKNQNTEVKMTENKVPRSFWIPELEADLLDQYRPHRIMWDSNDPTFNKTKIKKRRLKEITEILHHHWPQFASQLTPNLVVKKFNTLKSYYKRELRKMASAASRGETYEPQWEHFSRLGYLGSNPEYHRDLKNRKKRILNKNKSSAPTIVSLTQNNNTMLNAESEDSLDDCMKPGAFLDSPEVSMAETPTSEGIDDKFGHFVASIMKSIPESKQKDNMRIKIIQDLFDFKNS